MITVASYGGGINSTAMLIGMWHKHEAIDLILFADTGAEKPETYSYVDRFSRWLVAHQMPAIVTVFIESPKWGKYTLEADCLRRGHLPAIALGFKTCSLRWKLEPQEKYLNHFTPAMEAWKCGDTVTKLIGYDAGEPHRVRDSGDKKYTNRFPLVEWGWDREECVTAIENAELCVPPKSSCFFCPNMTEEEIIDLRDDHPDLMERALQMERNAKPNLTSIKGLARDMSWQQIVDYDRDQLALLPKRERVMPCACYDGD